MLIALSETDGHRHEEAFAAVIAAQPRHADIHHLGQPGRRDLRFLVGFDGLIGLCRGRRFGGRLVGRIRRRQVRRVLASTLSPSGSAGAVSSDRCGRLGDGLLAPGSFGFGHVLERLTDRLVLRALGGRLGGVGQWGRQARSLPPVSRLSPHRLPATRQPAAGHSLFRDRSVRSYRRRRAPPISSTSTPPAMTRRPAPDFCFGGAEAAAAPSAGGAPGRPVELAAG